MVDRLEEILKRAEPQAETEEESSLSPLRFLSAGAVLRAAMAGSAEERSGLAFEGEEAGLGVGAAAETAEPGSVVRRLWAADRLSALTGAGLSRAAGDPGLGMLYRRAGEAVRGAAAPGAAPSGITVVQEGNGITAGLTAEELDRAVRRDSRRYDGGMSIY